MSEERLWPEYSPCVQEPLDRIKGFVARGRAAQQAADQAAVDAQSLYDIPFGCICQGDGLLGMPCDAKEHATPKSALRTERVELKVGHLPEEFRQVARICTAAGAEGWEFVDAEIDNFLPEGGESVDDSAWQTDLLITFQRKAR